MTHQLIEELGADLDGRVITPDDRSGPPPEDGPEPAVTPQT